MPTNYFCAGDLSRAQVLAIGHDPRLQKSEALATYAFFADYYFRPIPTQRPELAKYKLAKAVFEYVGHLTSHKFADDKIVLTNLCNNALVHAPKGRTVYISESEARNGIQAIRDILSQSSISVIFAMSAQVNYWLQKLEFYPAVTEFLSDAEPRAKGVNNQSPYYQPIRDGAFSYICGKHYITSDNRNLFPVLHIKNWPLKGPFAKAYGQAYESCINILK